MTIKVGGILLAAGASRRFGRNKLCHRLADDTPMVVASAALLSGIVESVAVVDVRDESTQTVLAVYGIPFIEFDRAAEGMGGSIAFGVRHMNIYDAWMILLADMPFVTRETIHCVVHQLQQGKQIVAPRCNGQRGHPVGFGRTHFDALCELTGDVGGKSILMENQSSICLVDVDDPGCLLDIDVPEDLETIPIYGP